MGLFDKILSAVQSPERQASTYQIANIVGALQHLAGSQGVRPETTQAMISVIGQYVCSALKQAQSTAGQQHAESIVERYSGASPDIGAIQALFDSRQQGRMVQDAAQKIGLSTGAVQGLLPMVVPAILKLLQTGAMTSTYRGSNSVLGSFLDADHDGDVDLGDALAMASQHINQRG